MSEIEKKILENIDRTELVALTKKLVSIDTINPPADYSKMAPVMKALYDSLGLDVHIFEGQEGKPNVGARWSGNGEKKEILLLSGHMDVVPPGTGWEIDDPMKAEEKEGWLIGRGTADMKGSLAAQFLAVKALKKAGVQLKGDLYLFSTVDDETAGTMGLRYMVEHGFDEYEWPKPTFHILGEPTDLTLCEGFKGRMWIKITLKGKSAHGGNPSAGINAIEKMMKIIPGILSIKRMTHPLMGVDTVNLGTIEGGEKTNIVADTCTLTIDYRYVKPQTSASVEKDIRDVIAEAAKQDSNIKLTEFTVFERREPQEIPLDNHYVVSLKSLTEEITGKPAPYAGVLSAGDSYWTITHGIPAAFFGPGSMSVAHTSKEAVKIHELENAAKIFAIYAYRMLG